MNSSPPRIVRVLEIIKTNYTLGLMYLPILHDPQYSGVINAHQLVVKKNAELVIVRPGNAYKEVAGEKVYHVNLTSSLPNPSPQQVNETLSLLAGEFSKMLVRVVTLDSYEQLYDYSESTGQLDALQAQDWYMFLRLVRHALTHDQHWGFRERDLAKLPVTWRGRTIEVDMDGKDVLMEFYGHFEMIELLEDMYAFAETLA